MGYEKKIKKEIEFFFFPIEKNTNYLIFEKGLDFLKKIDQHFYLTKDKRKKKKKRSNFFWHSYLLEYFFSMYCMIEDRGQKGLVLYSNLRHLVIFESFQKDLYYS